jgi:ornithine decarboxylase
MDKLVAQLAEFEQLVKEDAPLSKVLPTLYSNNKHRYEGYTIRRLCQEMHDFYKKNDAKNYQKKLFRAEYLPKPAMILEKFNFGALGEAAATLQETIESSLPVRAMTPQEANWELVKNNAKLVALEDIVGEVALEGALPYPPGIFCVVPGEVWNEVAQKYFLILQEGINEFPGFAPEIQGVYLEKENGRVKAYGYVLDRKQ